MKNKIGILYFLLFCLCLGIHSCKDYLDETPSRKLAIPYTGDELQAILDYVDQINDLNPGLAEIASDNFFLPYENWQGIIQEENRDAYLWKRTPVHVTYWSYMYQKIYYANTVLDYVDKVEYKSEEQRRQIYGSALFVRGMAFHKLAEVFTVPYDKATAKDRLGVVLKLSSDINEKVERSTLEQTYQQIKSDLEKAIQYLPSAMPEYPTRASKAAAYGALARFYLSMRLYEEAGAYADSCLAIKSDLLDYNSVAKNNPYPFELYNAEVVYHSRYYYATVLNEENARVDSLLYSLYKRGDLRKNLFFTKQKDGYFSFTGDYSVNIQSNQKFDGITTSEMYLIRAESAVRNGNLDIGVTDLNTLKAARYSTGIKIHIPTKAPELLQYIFLERRKELVGRGVRWSDLRRLTLAKEIDIDLVRIMQAEKNSLSAEEIVDFSFAIPSLVIERSGVVQNH